jgi:hypothetical protein
VAARCRQAQTATLNPVVPLSGRDARLQRNLRGAREVPSRSARLHRTSTKDAGARSLTDSKRSRSGRRRGSSAYGACARARVMTLIGAFRLGGRYALVSDASPRKSTSRRRALLYPFPRSALGPGLNRRRARRSSLEADVESARRRAMVHALELQYLGRLAVDAPCALN